MLSTLSKTVSRGASSAFDGYGMTKPLFHDAFRLVTHFAGGRDAIRGAFRPASSISSAGIERPGTGDNPPKIASEVLKLLRKKDTMAVLTGSWAAR